MQRNIATRLASHVICSTIASDGSEVAVLWSTVKTQELHLDVFDVFDNASPSHAQELKYTHTQIPTFKVKYTQDTRGAPTREPPAKD